MTSIPLQRFNTNDVGGYSEGNRLRLLPDGDEAFAEAFERMRQAKERIWLETYILEPDEVGRPTLATLAAAARRGVDVLLIYDRWGSPRMSKALAQTVAEAGGRVALYNPVWPWRRLGKKVGSLLHRDHRKILIVDDVGYTGGRNVSADYGGPGDEVFYDVTLRLEGPCVRDLASVLLDSYAKATGRRHPLFEAPPPLAGGVPTTVMELHTAGRQRDLDAGVLGLLEAARHTCQLVTPYFVPPRRFLDALLRALRRGVAVEILTAGRSDVPIARAAGRHAYGPLLAAGARIYEMQAPTLHAKTLMVDDCWGLVGSYNVDQYGFRHNLEVGVVAEDPALAAALRAEFKRNMGRSVPYPLEAWRARLPWERLWQWFLFQLARV